MCAERVRKRQVPALHVITAHRLNYGEIKDPAKMTDSRMALVRRGLGAGNANANAQTQASNKARCGPHVCTGGSSSSGVRWLRHTLRHAVDLELEGDGRLCTPGARTRHVQSYVSVQRASLKQIPSTRWSINGWMQ